MRVTFVIPWYGDQPGGGAETLCREFSVRLAQAGHDVEVLTTCCRDHDADWNTNHWPVGRAVDKAGVWVERFAVDCGDRRRFSALNERLMRGEVLSYREEAEFFDQSISSAELVRAVELRTQERAIVAIPYLFGLTRAVVHAAADRAVLWPCLHDEGYARMKLVADVFSRSAAVVFNSAGEMELAGAMRLPVARGDVVGMGIDAPSSAETGGARLASEPAHFLYLGRRTSGKGFQEMCRLFAHYRAHGGRAELWVAGKGDALPGGVPGLHDLGFVDEARKWAVLRRALAVIMPSRLESFSLALLEGLAVGTPGVVNGACAVTRAHVTDGLCGLTYESAGEFTECLAALEGSPQLREALGSNGARYVAERYGWPGRIAAIETLLREVAPHAH